MTHSKTNASRKSHKALTKRLVRLRSVKPDRRRFLLQGVALLTAGAAAAWRAGKKNTGPPYRDKSRPVRPPTAALIDQDFQSKCIRCGLCGVVCENGCIRFFGGQEQEWGGFTPYIDVRQRSCTLCMRCTNICPTGALTPTDENLDNVADRINMGTAVVDPDLCISYLGRVCGYCHDACPLPQRAIKLIPPATPVVLTDGCVGCGRCVEFCPQNPTAIRIIAGGES